MSPHKFISQVLYRTVQVPHRTGPVPHRTGDPKSSPVQDLQRLFWPQNRSCRGLQIVYQSGGELLLQDSSPNQTENTGKG